MADKLYVRVIAKDDTYRDDVFEFTNDWTEIEVGQLRSDYVDNGNIQVVRDKKRPNQTEVTPDKPLKAEEETVTEEPVEAGG